MDANGRLGVDYDRNTADLDAALRIEESFDIIGRNILIAGRRARLYFIDGFAKDEIMEKIMEFIMGLEQGALDGVQDAAQFADQFVTYVETDIVNDAQKIVTGILSGTIALLVEGYGDAIMIDARTYPARGVEEPDDDRVLRGSRDGFVETLVHNTALIRRRIRDPALTMDILQIGSKSKTDVVVCYMENTVDKKLLEKMLNKLKSIEINTLTMSQESLAECLVRTQWFNPFPKVRYTERPDAATACVIEGSILLIVDNSPSVMILPTSLFDFVQDTNDYYFPPVVGTYLRLVRIAVYILTLFLTPVWYLLIENPDWVPDWLTFIQVSQPNGVPIIAQLLLIEFVIDGLKLASLNTPSVLSNSFSVVGALILGDFAVQARWFVPEVVLYMAFVAIATFTSPSFELGYAMKLFRVVLLILTALFGVWGFAGGVVLLILTVAFTRTAAGKSYLYPLIPFNGPALLRMFVRRPISRRNTR